LLQIIIISNSKTHKYIPDQPSGSSLQMNMDSDSSSLPPPPPPPVPKKPLNLVTAMLGDCLCQPLQQFHSGRGLTASTQFVELHGIRFIGLGALVDELTPRERVYDTLEQLTTRTQRLISIGDLRDEDVLVSSATSEGHKVCRKVAETVPLDVWNQSYPNDQSMSREVRTTVHQILVSSEK
jgi:hypothetical protein